MNFTYKQILMLALCVQFGCQDGGESDESSNFVELAQYEEALEREVMNFQVGGEEGEADESDEEGELWPNGVSPQEFCEERANECTRRYHESDRAESDRAESDRAESDRAESDRAESDRAENYRAELDRSNDDRHTDEYQACLDHSRRPIRRRVRHCLNTCSRIVQRFFTQCNNRIEREECVEQGREMLHACYESQCSDLLPPHEMSRPEGERPEGGRPEGGRPEAERPEGDRPEGGHDGDSFRCLPRPFFT